MCHCFGECFWEFYQFKNFNLLIHLLIKSRLPMDPGPVTRVPVVPGVRVPSPTIIRFSNSIPKIISKSEKRLKFVRFFKTKSNKNLLMPIF